MGRKRKNANNSFDTSNARIVIVGGGLAGLATALALERSAGFSGSIHVYEKDPSVYEGRREGYGLTLSYRPGGVLDKLGILDELSAADCPSRSHYLLRSDGTTLGYFGNAFTATRGFGQRGNLRVPRQKLREILARRLTTTTVHWDHRCVNIPNVDDQPFLELEFIDQSNSRSVFEQADIVVAADGVRSSIACMPPFASVVPSPRPMGIRLILGLTRPAIPTSRLLQEQGFYTLDDGIRLFVMPYTGSSLGRSLVENEPVRYMWQLSFVDSTIDRFTSEELQREARKRTAGWHEPVGWLMDHTPLESIWGTPLYDRDPTPFLLVKSRNIIVAGDALHAMSPFKGQGANQSLQDAVTIAQRISSQPTGAATIVSCQRELVQRTAKVVQASREAAKDLHDPTIVFHLNHAWAGIEEPAKLVEVLRQRQISAVTTENLDKTINEIVDECNILRAVPPKKPTDMEALQRLAVEASRQGDLGTLRRLSWNNSDFLVGDTSCIKIAATETGDLNTIHWLVTEAGCTLSNWKDWKLASPNARCLLERLSETHTKCT